MMKPAIAMGDRGLGWAGDSHPAWMLAHAKLLDYLVVGASAVGQMHLREGTGRDDAFLIRGLGPWLAIAVSDGIGSRPLSRFGASYTVESLTSQLLRPFSRLTPDPHSHRVTSPVPEAPRCVGGVRAELAQSTVQGFAFERRHCQRILRRRKRSASQAYSFELDGRRWP